MNKKPEVGIVGGGLSGLAAATILEKYGIRTTILEKRKMLGGQMASWKDSEGDIVETIHLAFPWYYNFARLYEMVDSPLPLAETGGDYHILDGDTEQIKVLESNPFSLIKSIKGLFNYPDFSQRDVGEILSFLVDILKTPMDELERFDDLTVEEFLEKYNFSENVNDFLTLEPITIQGLREHKASAGSFLKFMKVMYGAEGIFTTSFFRAPTTEVLITPLKRFITDRRGDIRINTEVKRITSEEGSANKVITKKGRNDNFDEIVLATPAYTIPELAPQAGNEFRNLNTLAPTGIICLQIWYGTSVFPDENVYISNRKGVLADAICDKAYHWRDDQGWGSIIQVLIDDASDIADLTDEEITKRALEELETFFDIEDSPAKSTVIRMEDTYAGTRPGYWDVVPRTHETDLDNLYVAGDFTSPPYHYGMESAVRSGIETANLILRKHNRPTERIEKINFPLSVRLMEKFL